MLDDPLALIVYGITALAAGMYPVGFLFGACSACCEGEECPEECSKCTHFFNDTACEDYMDFSVSMTSELFGNDTITQNGVCGADESFTNNDIGDDPSLPQCVLDVVEGFGVNYVISFSLLRETIADECGCAVFQLTGLIDVAVEYEGSVLRYAATFAPIDGDSCAGGVIPIEFAPIEFDANDGWPVDDPECEAELAQWLNNNLAFSGTITLGTCDCGACCDDGCEEDVAEGGCESWQGVGTDCDPDPCV